MEKFCDLKYERPDLKKMKEEYLAAIAKFKAAATFDEANGALLECSRILDQVMSKQTVASIRNTMNMKDEFYDGEMKFFNRELPKLMPLMKKGMAAALKSRFRPQLEEVYGRHYFKDAEAQQKLINALVILPTVKENNLSTEYSKIAASCSVEFMGETCNFYGLLRHMQSVDREERKAAFLAWAKLYEDVSPKLDAIYGKLTSTRRMIARLTGFKSYIDYAYRARGRYDYDAARAAEFREAVRRHITPICAKLYEEQATRLGVDRLRMYDESLVFPDGNANPVGTPEELVAKAHMMYSDMSPETKEFFTFMKEHELYDLVTRENKHLGGYMTAIPDLKAPFIFSNFNGTSADVDVLTHEAGHAFEYYYASRRLPLSNLTFSTSEINEIHSMTMEFFAYPYMDSFFGPKADRYRYAHFTEAIKTIPYLVSVDEFQHRVFENPGSGPADWRRYWREIEKKYMPWRDYDGNGFLEGGGFWMQKQHIFLYPFYYIDYALAQMGAFSLYRKKLEGGDAWGDYLKLCSMGGMYGYFETLERAGIPNPLCADTVKSVADFAKRHAEELRTKAVK